MNLPKYPTMKGILALKMRPSRIRSNCFEIFRQTYFERYGTDLFYSAFKHNKQTVWYVFYSVHDIDGETTFLVRYLTNNHVAAQHLEIDA